MLLVIDAAYAEYVSRNDYESGVELVDQAENVVMTRTFSKIYGMGGVRLGWMYGPAGIVDVISRLRQPFNVNLRGADRRHRRAGGHRPHRRQPHQQRHLAALAVSAELAKLGLKPLPSVGNFVPVGFGSKERAAAANDWLMNDGLIPRMIAGYGLPEHLRITIGTEAEVKAVRDSLAALRRRQMSNAPGQPMFDKIALIGIGLIGGSIALDARQRRPRQEDRRRDAQRRDRRHRQPAEAGRPLRHRSRRRLRGRRPGDRLHAGRRLRRGRRRRSRPRSSPAASSPTSARSSRR